MRSRIRSTLGRQPARVRQRRLAALERLKAGLAEGPSIDLGGKFINTDTERMASEIAVLEKRTAGGM